MTAWPTSIDYVRSIGNWKSCVSIPGMEDAQVEADECGPICCPGGWAIVFKAVQGQRTWAIRCLLKPVPGLDAHYEHFTGWLDQQRASSAPLIPYFVECRYASRAILALKDWRPALIMEWAGGVTLRDYLSTHRGSPNRMLDLAESWRQMIGTLDGASVAHGDLQPDNIRVEGESAKIRLIDYDSLVCPATEGLPSHILGTSGFHHPRRSVDRLNPRADRFPAFVIYLTIVAIAQRPGLWDEEQLGIRDPELLFDQQDFERPASSMRIRKLLDAGGRLRDLTEGLIWMCNRPNPMTLPTLDEMLRGDWRTIRNAPLSASDWWGPEATSEAQPSPARPSPARPNAAPVSGPDWWVAARGGQDATRPAPRGARDAAPTAPVLTEEPAGTPSIADVRPPAPRPRARPKAPSFLVIAAIGLLICAALGILLFVTWPILLPLVQAHLAPP